MRILGCIFCVMLTIAVAGCGNGEDRSVPRRTAYHRIEAYDSTYVALPQVRAVNIEINANAEVSIPRDSAGVVWIDVVYPRYKAVLHLTFNEAPGTQLDRIAQNREERFKRDAEGQRVVVTQVENDFADVIISRVSGSSVTPINIMASDGATFFLSGALELLGSATSAEESRPVVDAVYDDLVHIGRTLRKR